jgi:hypothetical protein
VAKKIVTVSEVAGSLSRWITSKCPCTCIACEALRRETAGVRIQTPKTDGVAKLFDVFFNGRKA